MATKPYNAGDKVKLNFSKKRFADLLDEQGNVVYALGADDKDYTGVIEFVQDNDFCTVTFMQGKEERQVSIPSSELTKV